MSEEARKDGIKVVVRIVERPSPVVPTPGKPYQPPKAPIYRAIATCEIKGKRFSRNATRPTEAEARLEAYSKLATLIAKQGAVPVQGAGVVLKQDQPDQESEGSS